MLEKLFGSKSRLKILSLFFGNENNKFYIQQIIGLAKLDSANTHRELKKLEKIGLLKSEKKANSKYYCLDKKYEYYEQLKFLFKKYNEKHGAEAWLVVAEMPNYYPQFVTVAWNVENANRAFAIIGLKNKFSRLLCKYEDNINSLIFERKEFNKIAEEIIDKFFKQPQLAEKYDKVLRARIEKLHQTARELDETNFKALSDEELSDLYKKVYKIYTDLHILHWIQSGLDFGENLFSKFLLNYLKTKADKSHQSIGDVFSVLTTPTEDSNAALEYKNLLKILEKIESDAKLSDYFKKTDTKLILKNLKNISPRIDNDLDRHAKDFGYLGYNTVGPAWRKDYFIDILGSLLRQGLKSAELLGRMKKEKQEIRKKRDEYLKKFKIEKEYQKIFAIARNMIFTKGIRKDSMFNFYCAMEDFYKEIGRRFYLSLRQVRYLNPNEIPLILEGKKISALTLNERYDYGVFYSSGGYDQDKFLTGVEAEKFLSKINLIKEDLENISILLGDTASAGRVRGEVKIVNLIEDMEKMKKGDVLVSVATTPDLIPAIKKAGAIVTDVGGITSHAAIVSREFGIPCVVGTKIATKILKDNDVLDVDATHGKVIIIKKNKK